MSILDQICADKRAHIKAQKKQTPLSVLKERIQYHPVTIGFKRKILESHKNEKPALIAEVKKASPSKGLIRKDFDPVQIARIYEQSGASCISVLTDTPYFQGKDDDLVKIRSCVHLPLLRKDFMLDPYQIYESRALGADCILLIMAALSDSQASALSDLAHELGMDVLVEVHNNKELERALELDIEMIGINNRNLKTLDVDIKTAQDLGKLVPQNIIKIAESGLDTYAQIKLLSGCGFHGFLVGESLMREDDIGNAVEKLMTGLDTKEELN